MNGIESNLDRIRHSTTSDAQYDAALVALIYFDASDRYDSMRSISMPPTTIDWLTARIPIWLH